MPGTLVGGGRTRQKILERYGKDYWSKIGQIGGQAKNSNKGFGSRISCNCGMLDYEHIKAQCSGIKGGSRRKNEFTR